MKLVDQYSNKTFSVKLKNKSQLPGAIDQLLLKMKGQGKEEKIIRCDNASEHQTKLKEVLNKHSVTMEFVAPNMPQHNGIVERKIVTDWNRTNAMLIGA